MKLDRLRRESEFGRHVGRGAAVYQKLENLAFPRGQIVQFGQKCDRRRGDQQVDQLVVKVGGDPAVPAMCSSDRIDEIRGRPVSKNERASTSGERDPHLVPISGVEHSRDLDATGSRIEPARLGDEDHPPGDSSQGVEDLDVSGLQQRAEAGRDTRARHVDHNPGSVRRARPTPTIRYSRYRRHSRPPAPRHLVHRMA